MLNDTKKVFDLLSERARFSEELCARYDQKINELKLIFNEEEAMKLLARAFPWLIRHSLIRVDELKEWFSPELFSPS